MPSRSTGTNGARRDVRVRSEGGRHSGEVEDQRIVRDLVRLYILHRSVVAPVGSATIAHALQDRGLAIDVRSVAQILRALHRKGYLKPAETLDQPSSRRVYSATRQGSEAVAESRSKLRFLYGTRFGDGPDSPLSQP